MSLDDLKDVHVEALLELAVGAVNAELQADLAEDAILGAYSHPRPLKLIPQTHLPALAVYRASEVRRRRTFGSIEDRGTFVFEFMSRAVGRDELALRWPLLRHVWKHLLAAIDAATHPAVAGGAAILELAGFTEILGEEASVQYGYVDGDSLAYPFFRGTIIGSHAEPPDLSALDDVLSLTLDVNLVGLPEGEQPLFREVIQAHHDVDGSEEFDGDLVP